MWEFKSHRSSDEISSDEISQIKREMKIVKSNKKEEGIIK